MPSHPQHRSGPLLLPAGQESVTFPPSHCATAEGLLAVGADLRPETLLAAYRRGIFPWYNPGQPILWWTPDPRAVLYPERLRISRSLRKALADPAWEIRYDSAFRAVMQACAAPRPTQRGTWIGPDMVQAYGVLHAHGVAHSVEAWRDGVLAGGLYGVALGGAFFGESMFSRVTDASKVALAHLVQHLRAWGYALIDCQVGSDHLRRLGAEDIPRALFEQQLAAALPHPGRPGPWGAPVESGV